MFDVNKVADALLDNVRRLIAPLSAKIAELEARRPEKGDPGRDGSEGARGLQGDQGRDGRDGQPGRDGANGKDGERGADGKDGAAGLDGKDGKDGLGWDDLVVEHDGERSFKFVTLHGDQRKEHGAFIVPTPIYRGVFKDGQSYEACDRVTWGGSEWHANERTSAKPGDGSKAWTLAVKKGRDGRDGDKGPTGERGPQGLPGRDRT